MLQTRTLTIRVVVYDKLTYAGNLDNLKDLAATRATPSSRATSATPRSCRRRSRAAQHRHHRQLRRRDARRPLDHGAGRLHQDRRLRHLRPARSGARARAGALSPGRHRRGLRRGARRLIQGDRPAAAAQPLLGQQGRRRPAGQLLLRHLRRADHGHPRLEQHRPLPVPGEGRAALRHQRHRRPAAAHLRRRPAAARLPVRARPLRGHRPGAAQGQRRARSTTSAPASRRTTSTWHASCSSCWASRRA